MTQFSVNATRLDPYKNFKFRVKFENRYVAGVSRVSALRRTTEVVEHRDGGDLSSARRSPGRTRYEPITLERGVTHDPEFETWANTVWNYTNAQAPADQRDREMGLVNFRRNVVIEVYNEAGQKVLAYQVFRCWVSEFQSLPDLDANANAIAIQTLRLENEGWIRDGSVTEPTEQPL